MRKCHVFVWRTCRKCNFLMLCNHTCGRACRIFDYKIIRNHKYKVFHEIEFHFLPLPPMHMHTQLLCSCVCNYKCQHKRDGEDFHSDGLCMSGIGTIRLHSHLIEDNIVHANYENDEVQYPNPSCSIKFSIDYRSYSNHVCMHACT